MSTWVIIDIAALYLFLVRMRDLSFALLFCFCTAVVNAQSPAITDAEGWFESAYVEWSPVDGADKYHVYVTGEGLNEYQIDDQLIRSYGTYFRADALGLKSGSYTLKVRAVIDGTEIEPAVTGTLEVMAHDRSGFAFSNGRNPGAYNPDGTLRSGAVVIYITENTRNTVSLDVTGANSNPCVGLQEILDGFKKGQDTRPLCVRMVGQITDFDYMLNGDIVIENKNNLSSHITLEGVGEDAVADGWGIRVKNATNIEIRNLGSMNCNSNEGDNIGLQQNNDHIWVHHVDFFYGDAGSDSDQAKGDGALDVKKSTYVTLSYNHFWDSGKSNLLGLGEGTTEGLYITYHHNWYDHSDSRHPRVRYYSAHVYNNYYDGNSKYGVGSTLGSSVFVEGNYFRNCKYPILTSMQGSDVFDEGTGQNDYSDMPTFSKEDGGTIKAFNNTILDARRFVAYGDDNFPNPTVDFDAYVASSREENVPANVLSAFGSNAYNNFDTDSEVMYEYTPDSPEQAVENVIQFAGRVNGGDFKWTFNNAVDDASSDVNTDLKSALANYQTSLVYVQGDGETPVFYHLTVSITGNGEVEPASGSYMEGTEVVLTAKADTGWEFDGWSGDATGTSTSITITMDGDKNMGATFVEFDGAYYTLTTQVVGQGTIEPASGEYPEGTNLTLKAVPASGWIFSGWSGDATGSASSTQLLMDQNKSVMATFEQIDGSGGDRIEDDDSRLISFDGSLKDYANADNGKAINLSNDPGKRIVWSYASEIDDVYQLTMRYTRKASVSDRGNLIVNGTSSEINFAETDGGEFTTSTYEIALATGDNPIIFETIDDGEAADIDWIELLGTTSQKQMFTLTVSVVGEGTVTPLSGTYEAGTEVTLQAAASDQYVFSTWSGDAQGTDEAIVIIMDRDKSIVATFVEEDSEVTEIAKLETVKMFPNPTTGRLKISLGADLNYHLPVSVFNAFGKKVVETNVYFEHGAGLLDLTSLPASVYFIRLVDLDDNVSLQRVVKR